MPQFLRQVLVQDETLTVSTVRTDDLPVNPLSVIYVTVKMLNNTTTLSDFSLINAILNQISKLEVLYKGSAIISGSLADLARLYGFLLHRSPAQTNADYVDNRTRCVTIPILLGRRPFWIEECFPAVRRGELQLQTTVAAAQTGVDTPVLQVETVELLGATPTRFMKATTISKTPTATGDHDVDLPIGNKIAHALLFGTTVPTAASYNASIGQLRLLVDNVESFYARANWETLHNEMSRRVAESCQSSVHQHLENSAGAYAQNATTDDNNSSVGFYDQYALLDFDPLEDSSYLLDTKGRARIHLRINADVADAIRIIPTEIIEVAGAGITAG
jgi:hypothetical protein